MQPDNHLYLLNNFVNKLYLNQIKTFLFMAHQTPKPILKNKKKSAFARPQEDRENKNYTFKQAFDEKFLAINPWGQFLLFIEDYYYPFNSKNHEVHQTHSSVLRNAINLLNEYHKESWGEILNRVPREERLDADELYRYISRYKRLTPLLKKWTNIPKAGYICTSTRP